MEGRKVNSGFIPCAAYLPQHVIEKLDRQARLRGITRQALIKVLPFEAVGIHVTQVRLDGAPRCQPSIRFFKAPDTALLPHIGFETTEAMSAKADIALRHLENFLERKKQ